MSPLRFIMRPVAGSSVSTGFCKEGGWLKREPELTTKLVAEPWASSVWVASARQSPRGVSAMGMHVAYTGRTPQNVSYRFLPDVYALAAASDFLVVACPGGAATRNMVNADVLAALGEKGVVINIARGSIIDEPALVQALANGRSRARVSTFSPTNPNVRPK